MIVVGYLLWFISFSRIHCLVKALYPVYAIHSESMNCDSIEQVLKIRLYMCENWRVPIYILGRGIYRVFTQPGCLRPPLSLDKLIVYTAVCTESCCHVLRKEDDYSYLVCPCWANKQPFKLISNRYMCNCETRRMAFRYN